MPSGSEDVGANIAVDSQLQVEDNDFVDIDMGYSDMGDVDTGDSRSQNSTYYGFDATFDEGATLVEILEEPPYEVNLDFDKSHCEESAKYSMKIHAYATKHGMSRDAFDGLIK